MHALAQLKFGLIKGGELVKDLDAAERQAKDLIDRIDREIAEAAERREEAFVSFQKAQEQKAQKAADYDAAIAESRAFENAVAPQIAIDPVCATLNERVEEIGKILEEAEKKAAQAESDRQRKKTPYEQDRLFMYLWGRKFGTSEYKFGFFVRYFDELIARLIGYREARANYFMLNQIPDRLREHAGRVRTEFEAAKQRLSELRHEKLLAAGAGPLEERARKAKAALDAAEQAFREASPRFEAADEAYGALIGRDNQGAFDQAIKSMAENDSRDEIVTLYREAARTTTDEDRAIVVKIDQLTLAIGKADGEVARTRQQIRELAARRAELQGAYAEFRRRHYDYPGTTFGNEATINDVLGGILDGMVGGAVLGQVLQQGYQRPPTPPWSENVDLGPIFPPGPSPMPSPGRASDDDFSTGGAF
ncbi:hypothetical protein [Methylocystis sp.]|uniref:hypothetical protein n=1 Tax=Methylocystis sp. TaxID=1911079 RepID=UPI0025F466E3|nr:hypothetical protein [Methylocystis sp.]